MPTPTPTALTFDDLSNTGRPFNGAGPTSATLAVLSAVVFRQVDIENGGNAPTTVNISCAGQLTVTVSLAPQELRIQQTGWTRPCPTIQFSSSSAWDANFDNLVFQ